MQLEGTCSALQWCFVQAQHWSCIVQAAVVLCSALQWCFVQAALELHCSPVQCCVGTAHTRFEVQSDGWCQQHLAHASVLCAFQVAFMNHLDVLF